MSVQHELLDTAFAIFELEKDTTWPLNFHGKPMQDWAGLSDRFSLLNSEFGTRNGHISQIDRVRIELLEDEMNLVVRRTDSPDEYENAFISDIFLPPLKDFLVHDHALCLRAVAKVRA